MKHSVLTKDGANGQAGPAVVDSSDGGEDVGSSIAKSQERDSVQAVKESGTVSHDTRAQSNRPGLLLFCLANKLQLERKQ